MPCGHQGAKGHGSAFPSRVIRSPALAVEGADRESGLTLARVASVNLNDTLKLFQVPSGSISRMGCLGWPGVLAVSPLDEIWVFVKEVKGEVLHGLPGVGWLWWVDPVLIPGRVPPVRYSKAAAVRAARVVCPRWNATWVTPFAFPVWTPPFQRPCTQPICCSAGERNGFIREQRKIKERKGRGHRWQRSLVVF